MKALFAVTIFLFVAAAAFLAFGPRSAPRDPASDLFFFEPHAGGCGWYRLDPRSGETDLLSVFHCDCANVQWSFSPDAERALVWFDTETYGSGDLLLHLVDVKRQKPERLPVPERGQRHDFAFDEAGRIVAFTVDDEVETVEGVDGRPALVFGGQTFDAPAGGEGTPALAHRLIIADDGRWRIEETVATRCCTDDAPGPLALPSYSRFASDKTRNSRDSARALRAEPTTFLRLDDRFKPVLGGLFAPRDKLVVATRGAYTLVADWRSGTRPHVFEAATGSLAFANKLAHGAFFWPQKPTPASPPDPN